MNLSTHLLGHIHNHNGMNKRLALLNQRTFNIKKNQVLQKRKLRSPLGQHTKSLGIALSLNCCYCRMQI